MTIKTIITTIISLSIAGSALAQDKIFQSNGSVIEAKIKSINDVKILYRHWNDQRGAVYSISLSVVDKVIYEDGYVERFNGTNSGANEAQAPRANEGNRVMTVRSRKEMLYGDRLLSVAPIEFTENGVGVAVSYEKTIDKAGYIAFVLPVMATFNLNNSSESDYNKHQDAMFYVSPGLKFYPTSCYGRTKYSVGPSLVIGAGEKTTGGEHYVYTPYNNTNYQFEPYSTHSKFTLGILVNNSININASPRMSLGLDFGFGFTYINTIGGSNAGMTGMVQGGFKIGYRY